MIEGLVKSHTLGQGGDSQEILIHSCHLQLLALSAVQNDCISSKNSGEAWMSVHWNKEENHGNYV